MHAKWSAFALAGLLLVASAAFAVAPEVHDEAKFFSPDAVKKANKEIRELASKHDTDFLIETMPSIPGDEGQRVKAMSVPDREKFFKNWAADRAETAVVNGVYLLVCKDPPHLHVEASGRGQKVLDRATINKVREQLLTMFRQKKFDEGLLQAVATVRARLETRGE
jgi:uncharacterized membrane protein YgcG